MASSQDHPQTRRGGDGDSSGIGGVHGDALYEILLRVPAKPLCRFRAVCRSWRSLLSSPSLVAAHAARHQDQPLLAVCDSVLESDHDETRTEIKLLDTTSGHVVKRFDAGPLSLVRRVWLSHLDLVLIVRRRVSGVDHHHRLSVLDTATGAVTVLPGGYYDDTRSSFVFGRWSSSKGGDHGEYKVLSLNTPLPLNRYATRPFCKILTVGGGGHGAWRDAPAPPVTIKTFHRGETVVASGVVYHQVDSCNGWTIVAFDLEVEQWLPDLLHGPAEPVPPTNSRERRSLAEVNRRLAAVYSTSSAMELWLLMGSGEKSQWCKRCRVPMSFMVKEFHCYWFTPDPVPLWVMDDGTVAFWLRGHVTQDGTLWMYDPRTETCTRLSNCLRIGAGGYTGNLLRQ